MYKDNGFNLSMQKRKCALKEKTNQGAPGSFKENVYRKDWWHRVRKVIKSKLEFADTMFLNCIFTWKHVRFLINIIYRCTYVSLQ